MSPTLKSQTSRPRASKSAAVAIRMHAHDAEYIQAERLDAERAMRGIRVAAEAAIAHLDVYRGTQIESEDMRGLFLLIEAAANRGMEPLGRLEEAFNDLTRQVDKKGGAA
jgi:hypothetical protein